ncbi:hypothetical protein B7463_g10743, partial [Scytalidium lignicola]
MYSPNVFNDEDEFVDVSRGGFTRMLKAVPVRQKIGGSNINVEPNSGDYGVEAFSDLDTPTSEDEIEEKYVNGPSSIIKDFHSNTPKQQTGEDETEANTLISQTADRRQEREKDAMYEYSQRLQTIYMREHSEGIEDSKVTLNDLSKNLGRKDNEKPVVPAHVKRLTDTYMKEHSEGAEVPATGYVEVQRDTPPKQKNEGDHAERHAETMQNIYLREYSEGAHSDSCRQTTGDLISGLEAEIAEFRDTSRDIPLAHPVPEMQIEDQNCGILKAANPCNPPSTDSFLDFVSSYVDSIDETLQQMHFVSHYNLGSNFRAIVAHKALTEFMGFRKGWRVTPSAYCVDNAFIAEYDSGQKGPVISFNVEYGEDATNTALRYHNLTALASVSAALAAAEAMTRFQLPGKVVLFGIPKAGRITFLRAGVYSIYKVDINLVSRSRSDRQNAIENSDMMQSFKAEYFGKEAQTTQSPSAEINALDALITAYSAISMLRQHLQSGEAIRSHIINGGSMPSTNHGYASGMFAIQALNENRLVDLKRKVTCPNHTPAHPERTLERVCRQAYNDLGGDTSNLDVHFSEDNDSAVPSIVLRFPVTSEGHSNEDLKAAIMAGKAIGITAVEVLRDGKLLGKRAEVVSDNAVGNGCQNPDFQEDWHNWMGA